MRLPLLVTVALMLAACQTGDAPAADEDDSSGTAAESETTAGDGEEATGDDPDTGDTGMDDCEPLPELELEKTVWTKEFDVPGQETADPDFVVRLSRVGGDETWIASCTGDRARGDSRPSGDMAPEAYTC